MDLSEKDFQAYIMEKFNGGFDYTFECVGNVVTMVFFTDKAISIYTA